MARLALSTGRFSARLRRRDSKWEPWVRTVLECLALHPSSCALAARLAADRLAAWAIGHHVHIQVSFQDRLVNGRLSDTKKTCVIEYFRFRLLVTVRRRRQLESLGRLAARAVAGCLAEEHRAEELGLPRGLGPALTLAWGDSWGARPWPQGA
jgi:hypothetical protein